MPRARYTEVVRDSVSSPSVVLRPRERGPLGANECPAPEQVQASERVSSRSGDSSSIASVERGGWSSLIDSPPRFEPAATYDKVSRDKERARFGKSWPETERARVEERGLAGWLAGWLGMGKHTAVSSSPGLALCPAIASCQLSPGRPLRRTARRVSIR